MLYSSISNVANFMTFKIILNVDANSYEKDYRLNEPVKKDIYGLLPLPV